MSDTTYTAIVLGAALIALGFASQWDIEDAQAAADHKAEVMARANLQKLERDADRLLFATNLKGKK